ncbi:MAG: mitochondrial fission ELM1 family protein [Rhodospirillales bacterium]|nr:mitochondrial fission ELM1 family protein [Rhodospirillales bacterium]
MTDRRITSRNPVIWVLLDDRAGNRSQCLGVAEALGRKFHAQELDYVAAAALPNFFVGASYAGLTASSRVNLVPPWPDLVVAAGRRTAPIARKIKKDSGGTTILVQIMYPGPTGLDEFDLVAAPRHDGLAKTPNLFEITGAPHRVTETFLAKAADDWKDRFAELPRPWIALIVGGSSRRRTFTSEMAADLGRTASSMAQAVGGSLLVTTSRRTGDAEPALLRELTVPKSIFKWGDEGENPYFGYLALADSIIVTGDSVSMVCEACAQPHPVYVYGPKALIPRKHGKLHQELFERGFARPLQDRFEHWEHDRLNPAEEIAAEIQRRFGL